MHRFCCFSIKAPQSSWKLWLVRLTIMEYLRVGILISSMPSICLSKIFTVPEHRYLRIIAKHVPTNLALYTMRICVSTFLIKLRWFPSTLLVLGFKVCYINGDLAWAWYLYRINGWGLDIQILKVAMLPPCVPACKGFWMELWRTRKGTSRLGQIGCWMIWVVYHDPLLGIFITIVQHDQHHHDHHHHLHHHRIITIIVAIAHRYLK